MSPVAEKLVFDRIKELGLFSQYVIHRDDTLHEPI